MKYKGISVIKRKGRNTWQARYRKNGKQYSVSAKSQRECYLKLKSAINGNEINTGINLNEWIKKWMTTYKLPTLRKSTFNQLSLMIKNYFVGPMFEKPINKIKPIEVENYLNSIPYERTKQNAYVYLKEIFTKAVSNELIAKNPLSDTKKPKYTRQQRNALTLQEQKLFEDYCLQDKERYIYLVCLWQGLRLGELRALQIEDFDFEKNTLTINKSINDTGENLTKNEYSNRVMPLFDKTKQIVQQLEYKVGKRMFTRSKDYISRKLKEILQHLNIEDITMHSLRHTFITRMQENNVQLYILQSWVGHAPGSDITTKIYTHIQKDAEQKVIDYINKNT